MDRHKLLEVKDLVARSETNSRVLICQDVCTCNKGEESRRSWHDPMLKCMQVNPKTIRSRSDTKIASGSGLVGLPLSTPNCREDRLQLNC
ncbi:hypothetical protein KR51_00031900 [Rubidibacter lacunae KORDI 51-2]|uniref:Uncharacterized protein n=1 Tax=Rubidibacter lacunae KORDI 51-2 TaxID=582515 RepID=U5D6G8_9CHRO|nr:hypothetical protein KR51_00031900 [Rubidibacter lacunae KORDI 51-2]